MCHKTIKSSLLFSIMFFCKITVRDLEKREGGGEMCVCVCVCGVVCVCVWINVLLPFTIHPSSEALQLPLSIAFTKLHF
jgi:hypothetical protein